MQKFQCLSTEISSVLVSQLQPSIPATNHCHILIDGTSFSVQSRCTLYTLEGAFPLYHIWSGWCENWVWEGSSLAVQVQQSGSFVPGELFRVLGNSPTRQQLQLYSNLMKTLPVLSSSLSSSKELCQSVPADLDLDPSVLTSFWCLTE